MSRIKKSSPPMERTSREKGKSALDSPAHYNAILIEEMRSQMQLVIEKVEGVEERLITRMDDRFAKVDDQLQLLTSTTQEHSHRLNRLENKLDQTANKLDQTANKLDQTANKLDQIAHELKHEIAKVDAKLDQRLIQVEKTVERHEHILTERDLIPPG
ncbi:MAG: hypothetical protein HYV03_08070 [Deltaproteobacteria bacterium]|nr:hypothetical protein [Deltaproteobacteria bacterium]